MNSELNTHEKILAALAADDHRRLQAELADVRAADIAESFELLDDEERSRILFALRPQTAAEVVVMLGEAVRGEVVDDLNTESLSRILASLPPDDAADVLGELSEQEVGELLDHMQTDQSEKIEGLLGYDEDSAGGIMTPDVVAVPADLTVGDAIEHVRDATQDDDLNEIYIVDENQKPIGTVPLRRLVTGARTTRLVDVCDRDPVVVFASDDQETVIQVIRKYDAMEAVVVDANGRLIGRITHDDLLDVADQEAEEDFLRMGGTDAAELETHSVFRAARIRLTWLLPCLVGMTLSAAILIVSKHQFDPLLFAALAVFVPMIGATGGNSGLQISTVIVRGFASGELAYTRLLRVGFREGRIALAMAPVCGLVAWILVNLSLPILTYVEPASAQVVDMGRVAIAVGCAMTFTIIMAAALGIALPFGFRSIGQDPAISSGPLVTTLNDVVSVTTYMLIAMWIAR